MKKFLLAALLLVMGAYAQAQIVSSSSSRVVRIVEPVEQKPTQLFEPKFYVKGGFSNLDYVGDQLFYGYGESDHYGTLGYNLVFGYEKPFFQRAGESACISWGIEAGLASRGTEFEFGGNYVNILKNGLIVNPKLVAHLGTPKFSWYYDLGLFLQYDYESEIVADLYDLEYVFDELTAEQNTCVGLSVNTGFWINRFEIGVGALLGVTPMFGFDDESFEGTSMTVNFHVGWAF